ncbi:MAG: UvrD-helicase domain-containing protein [Planctomycetota bacterium]
MSRLLDNLNPAQREAVEHVDGPLLILAGPGSGKTRVVTHRIARLIESGVHASQILALTFTNKAADEMRRRVGDLSPGRKPWVSTFHRFGVRTLREHADLVGLPPGFTIYDSSDSRATLKRVLEAEQIQTLGYTADRIAAAISGAKNKLIGPEEFQPTSSSPLSRVVAEAYPAYQARMRSSAAVDFDDLLLMVARLLHDHPEVRSTLDARYRYVMVDEYQDTNRVQYVILRALSHDLPNLAATGDPDQSIYGWRGADLNNILEFEADYPGVKVVRLEQNYRSTKKILRVADALIAHNKRRKKKSLFTENDDGADVRLVTYADGNEEARDIAQQIRRAIDNDRRASDFAIFYRTNALSRAVEKALRAERVPLQIVRGQEFFQRKEIKDVLAYCQLVCNPRDDVALARVINSPPRGIGKKTIDRIDQHAYRYGAPLLEACREVGLIEGIAKRSAASVLRFVEIMQRIASHAHGSVEEVIGAVLTESGYRDHLKASDDDEDAARLENIEELLTDARQFDEQHDEEAEDALAPLEAYLERTWLAGETDGYDGDGDKVTLMTLHAAKGLEFPEVYLIAVEDGILPHERSLDDVSQLEEERRLAFVGITRAERRLQISHVVRRDFRGMRRIAIPSGFLMEIPRDELDAQQAASPELELMGWDEANDADPWADSEPSTQVSQPSMTIAAASVTTGAALEASQSGDAAKPAPRPKANPDVFAHGMAVTHPEYGLGKIVTLSGAGAKRKATVRFATSGERQFMLAHSPLQPAGKR